MPKVSLVIIMLLQAVTSFAQNYFVFIGSDNRQPFYVRVDSEFHSSSAEGHLILSQLKDGNYNITVGFPGKPQPEQHYSFSIGGKDQAFELRSQDAASSELRMYDLQNNQWLSLQGGGVASGEARSAGVKKDDAFSRMMAGVVHDTAVLYDSYAMARALSDSPAVANAPSAPAQSSTAQSPATTTQPTAATIQSPAATTKSVAQPQTIAQSGPPDTASATAGITTPPTTHTPPTMHASPDSAGNKPADTTITATSNSDTSQAVTSTSPGTTSPGTTSPGTTSPGTTSPGTTIPGAVIPGTTTAGTAVPATGSSAITPAGATPIPTSQAGTTMPTTSAVSTTMPATSSASATSPAASPAGAMAHQPAPRFNDSSATTRITKLSERHTTKNVRLVYALRSGTKKADTIDVVIPIDSPATAKTGRQPHPADSNHIPAARAHGLNVDTPAVSSSTASRPTTPPAPLADATRPHPADSSHKPGKTIAFVNSDCHDFATDFDVDRLRVRMLEFSKDEERIAAARKEFKIRCFYTRQIRALSDVFTSDAAKFRFFEAAWPFAADEHFPELSDLLTDPTYNARFKTMTHQQ